MRPYIQISIQTKTQTAGWSIGEKFIDSLEISNGLLSPEYISHNADKFNEPLENASKIETLWAEKATIRANGSLSDFYLDFAWKRKKVAKCVGSVVHTSYNLRGQVVPGAVRLYSAYTKKINWYLLFKTWCNLFQPQLGMLHLFTKPELRSHERNNSFQIGSFNSALRPDVPNAGWAMFYGDKFSETIDLNKFIEAGFPVERIGNGYLVMITDNIHDVESNFLNFSGRRDKLKKLFHERFFLIE